MAVSRRTESRQRRVPEPALTLVRDFFQDASHSLVTLGSVMAFHALVQTRFKSWTCGAQRLRVTPDAPNQPMSYLLSHKSWT